MNIKFVSIGLVIIGALFAGTEIYWSKQFEQQARDNFNDLSFVQLTNETMKRAGFPIKVDALNHYPNILVYINLTQKLADNVSKDDLRKEIQHVHKQMTCGYFDYVRSKEQDDKYKDIGKGVVSVVTKDQPAMTYFFKTYDGQVIYEKKQVLSECSEFLELKQSIS